MIYNNILVQFNQAIPRLHEVFLHYGEWLFFALVSLNLTWFSISLILYRRGVGDFGLGALVIHVFQIGVGLTMWTFGDNWVQAILNSFRRIGAEAAGVSVIDPSVIMSKAISVNADMLWSLGFWGLISHPGTLATVSSAALITFLCIAAVALHMLYVLIWGQMLVAISPLMIAFMGSRWTTHFTDRFFSSVLSTGAVILALYLMVGFADHLTQDWAIQIRARAGSDVSVLFEVAFGAGIYFILTIAVPRHIGQMFTNGIVMTMSEVAGTLAMVSRFTPHASFAGNASTSSSSGTPPPTSASAASSPAPSPPSPAQAAQTFSANWSSVGSKASSSSSPSQTSAAVNQFRNAGQTPKPQSNGAASSSSSSQSNGTPPQVQNKEMQKMIEKWSHRGQN